MILVNMRPWGKEFTLKDPSPADPALQSVINDPNLEIKSIGSETKSGEMYFDLKSNEIQIRIKINCQKRK